MKASLTTAHAEVGVAEANGIIYVVGGFGPTGTRVATVDAYDVSRDSWRTVKPLPIALDHPAAARVDRDVVHVALAAVEQQVARLQRVE